MNRAKNIDMSRSERFRTSLPVVVCTALALFWGSGYLMIPVDDFMFPWIDTLTQNKTIADMLQMSYYLGSYAVPLGLCLLYMYLTKRESVVIFSHKYHNNGIGTFFAGMLAGFLLNGSLILPAVLTGKIVFSFSEFLILPLLAVLAGGIVQCSCEEVLYRGYMYQFLKSRYGVMTAMISGSVTFLLGHFGNLMYYGFQPAFMMNIVLLGMVFALLMRRTGSFWFACGMHTMWNFTQQYLFGLSNSGMVSLGAVFAGSAETDSFFFNTVFGIEGSWCCAVVLSILTGFLILLEHKKPIFY